MRDFIVSGIFVGFALVFATAHAETVYDATQPTTLWWYGTMPYEEVGNVVQLAGTARDLDSVTLTGFYHLAGEFQITASIYAVPDPIVQDDTITSQPLWTSTADLVYGDTAMSDVVFTGQPYLLPDQFVLDFTLNSISGQGGLTFHVTDYQAPPEDLPVVGGLGSRAYYFGMFLMPATWTIPDPDDPYGTFYSAAKVTAVPGPAAIIPFAAGVGSALFARRRRRK